MMAAMRRIATILGMMAFVAGCGSGDARNTGQPEQPANASSGQPANAGQAAVQLTPAWLAGRWQAGEGGCAAGDIFFTLEPDGRYAFAEEQGRWTLDGDRLTIEVTRASSDSGTEAGQRATTIVRPLGPDEAEFVPEGQAPIRVVRCPNP